MKEELMKFFHDNDFQNPWWVGNVVEVQMGNDGVFEFKSKYNVKNYKSSGAF